MKSMRLVNTYLVESKAVGLNIELRLRPSSPLYGRNLNMLQVLDAYGSRLCSFRGKKQKPMTHDHVVGSKALMYRGYEIWSSVMTRPWASIMMPPLNTMTQILCLAFLQDLVTAYDLQSSSERLHTSTLFGSEVDFHYDCNSR